MNKQKERPLSPHATIYKLGLPMILSFIHRLCGIALAVGIIPLIYWLYSISEGAESYSRFQSYSSHWLGQTILFCWTFALFYHLCNGIRHLFWDIGRGFEIKTLYTSGIVSVITAISLTLGTWVLVALKQSGV